MRWSILPAGLIAIAMMSSGTASACNWTYDVGPAYVGDSDCAYFEPSCIADYLCLGGSPPPQAVNQVLHCAGRAAGESEDLAEWAPLFVYLWPEWGAATAAFFYPTAHGAVQPSLDDANEVLCDDVWDLFCSNPIVLPSCPAESNPLNERPF